jgi:O-antigen/teichoic acid export membrane protein
MSTTAQTVPTREMARTALRSESTIRPLSLKVNAIWTTLGNGAYAAAQWLQIALIAHLGTSADVGHYALAMSICTPAFMLFNLQLRSIQATDSVRSYVFNEYLGLRLISSCCALVVVLASAAFLSGSREAVFLTLILGTFKAIESISDIYQGLLQQFERMDYVGRSFVYKSGLIIGSFGSTYYLTGNIIGGTFAMLAAQMIALLYDIRASYIAANGKAQGWRIMVPNMLNVSLDRTRLKALAQRALPLGIAMMLISLYANLPRFVLNGYVGPSGVGIFAAITYFSMIGGLFMTALGTAISPRLSQYAVNNRPAFRQLLGRFVFTGAIVGVLGMLVSVFGGQALLTHLYGLEYAAHSRALVWIMLAGALTYVSSGFGFGATALGCFKEQPWIVACATVVLLGTSLLLVPTRGLEGAAIAMVIATSMSLCGYMGLVKWKSNEC